MESPLRTHRQGFHRVETADVADATNLHAAIPARLEPASADRDTDDPNGSPGRAAGGPPSPSLRERAVQDRILEVLGDGEWTEGRLRGVVGGDASLVSRLLRRLLEEQEDRQVLRLGMGKRGNPFRYVRASVHYERLNEWLRETRRREEEQEETGWW